jgi:hypothetical protein
MRTLRALLASLGAAGAAANAGAVLQRQADEERAVAVLRERLPPATPPAPAPGKRSAAA